jgi:hypothetical protein
MRRETETDTLPRSYAHGQPTSPTAMGAVLFGIGYRRPHPGPNFNTNLIDIEINILYANHISDIYSKTPIVADARQCRPQLSSCELGWHCWQRWRPAVHSSSRKRLTFVIISAPSGRRDPGSSADRLFMKPDPIGDCPPWPHDHANGSIGLYLARRPPTGAIGHPTPTTLRAHRAHQASTSAG